MFVSKQRQWGEGELSRRDIKKKLSNKSTSQITCTAFLAYFPIPQATRAGSVSADDIALTFPALTLQSCVIWWNATPLSPLFVWIREPLECIRFLPQGVGTLEKWSYLHQLASPNSLLPPLSLSFLSAEFHQRPVGFTSPIRHMLTLLTHNRRTCERQYGVSGVIFLIN